MCACLVLVCCCWLLVGGAGAGVEFLDAAVLLCVPESSMSTSPVEVVWGVERLLWVPEFFMLVSCVSCFRLRVSVVLPGFC